MTVRNAQRLVRRLNQIPIAMRKGVRAGLARGVIRLDAYAKERIQGGSRGGIVYHRRSVSHQASAPGEFPKTDTGQLVSSLFFEISPEGLSARWGTTLNYGKWLEFGTSTMLSRPWMRPTFEANRKAISADIAQEVRLALKGVSNFG